MNFSAGFRLLASVVPFAAIMAGGALTASAAAPPNDNFNSRAVLVGNAATSATVSNVEATTELGEPLHPTQNSHSLWWSWTALATGSVSISTLSSAEGTELAVYVGNSLSTLRRVVANDAFDVGTSQSIVIFQVAAGTEYQIAVVPDSSSAYNNVVVRVTLTPNSEPPSVAGADRFADAPFLTGTAAKGVAENSTAGFEAGERATSFFDAGTVWWKWTAPAHGFLDLETLASTSYTYGRFDLNTSLGVFVGDTISTLKPVLTNEKRFNSDSVGLAGTALPVTAGQTYAIALSCSGSTTERGSLVLDLRFVADATAGPAPVGTDSFGDRPRLTGPKAQGIAGLAFSGVEGGEPVVSLGELGTVWWEWVPVVSGPVVINTRKSVRTIGDQFLDTFLTVFRGTTLSGLSLVGQNDNAGGFVTSEVTFDAIAGQSYQIRVNSRSNTVANMNGMVWLSVAQTELIATPSIVSQPRSQTSSIGAAVTFTVGATGSPLSYQWQFNGANIAGATSPTYTLSPVAARSGGRYSVIVSNGAESRTSNDAVLSVIAAPVPSITIPSLLPAGGSLKQARALAEQPGLGVLVAVSGAYPAAARGIAGHAGWGSLPRTAASIENVIPHLNTSPATNLSRVVRLLADGKPDPKFTSTPGADGPIHALAVDASNRILVGGLFQVFHARGLFRNIARLNPDGTADATFSQLGSSTEAQVNALAVQRDGRILVGGAFRTFGAETWPYLVRLNSDGSLDRTFKPVINGDVNTIALQADGRIVVGGNFSSPRTLVARLLDNGAVDPSFDPGLGGGGEIVTLVLEDGDRSLVAAGSFTRFAGQPRERIVKLLSTGALDPAFSPVASANDTVFALGLQANGKIVLGGAFTKVNGADRPRIARLNADGALDLSFDPSTGANRDVLALLIRSDGSLYLGGLFDRYQDTIAEGLAAVQNHAPPPPEPNGPTISAQPRPAIAPAGSSVTFNVSATGTALTYQWQFKGVNIPGATSAMYTRTKIAGSDAGSYRVVISAPSGTVTSVAADLTVTGRLVNLSVRTTAGTGAETLIVGFSLGGGRKQLLIRGVGPTLGVFGVPNSLADPLLALLQETNQVANNDNWGGSTTLANAFASVGAFPLSASSLDSALYQPLDNGSYTAQLAGKAGANGVGLLELYDAGGDDAARLVNLSARCQVGTGDNILIVGFNITEGPITLLVRGVGPTLASFGVDGTLADPRLQLNSATGIVVENDNWEASLGSTFGSVGAFPLQPGGRDAAVRVTLPPGSYTAQVSGVNGATGIALVEVYELP